MTLRQSVSLNEVSDHPFSNKKASSHFLHLSFHFSFSLVHIQMADYLCMSVAARCSAQAQHAEAILSAPSTTTNATSPILRSLGFPLARRFSKHQGGHDIKMRIRIVPAIDDPGKSLIFNIVDRELEVGKTIKFGRLLDRSSPEDVTFKSKVVSRSHCEIWLGDDGKVGKKGSVKMGRVSLNIISFICAILGPRQALF